MAVIVFERLVGRNVARFISDELDLAGIKTTANTFIGIAIIGWIIITVLVSFSLVLFVSMQFGLAFIAGMGMSVMYEVILYSYLELMIEQRKSFVEEVLPDYLQLTAANMRSGVSLSMAMNMAVRPEFKYFSDDIRLFGKQLYSGETMANAFNNLAAKYRSVVLKRTVRVIIQAEQYGGGMADLLNQIAKDLRGQQIVQKEVAGQLFMYTIFIAFAALIGAPTLYGLTNQMITVTSNVWSKISVNSLSNLPSIGISFVKLSKPLITPQGYYIFSVAAIIIITGFGSFIISSITSGATIRGIRYMPVFIVLGLIIFFIVSTVMGGLFASLAAP